MTSNLSLLGLAEANNCTVEQYCNNNGVYDWFIISKVNACNFKCRYLLRVYFADNYYAGLFEYNAISEIVKNHLDDASFYYVFSSFIKCKESKIMKRVEILHSYDGLPLNCWKNIMVNKWI